MTALEAEIHYITVDFHKLRAARWKGRASAGSTDSFHKKRPVLFFNGIGGNLEMATPLAEFLQGSRDVITFDVPGAGGSDDPKFPYRLWWIARAANKILEKMGYDGDIDVVGVSWGGAAAQQFAIQYKKRVRHLVLCATSAGMLMVPGNLSSITKMTDNRRYTDPDYLMLNYQVLYGDTEKHVIEDHAVRVTPPSSKGYYYQLLAAMGWTSAPFLPFIKAKTLIMGGDRDHLVPLVNAKILASLIPGAELDVIKEGGHLFIIARADEICERLIDFFDAGQGLAAGSSFSYAGG